MSLAHERAVHVVAADKTFAGGRRALRGVSFDVQPGERVALLGASGSGKSTLLRALCGLETLDAANGSHIEVLGRSLQSGGRLAADIRAQRRAIGVIFQQFNLVGRLSVLSNVLTGLAPEMSSWRAVCGRFSVIERARALDALDAMGLGEQAFQRASTLSGGQQQRAAIARTLVQGARLMLADEPVASLDPESTRRVMELLLQINREQGLTLLVSLHHVGLARRYCERVLALRDGALVFDGPTTQLSPAFLRDLYGTAVEELQTDDPPSEPMPLPTMAVA
ncbi:MAG: phosphonate ABC transporter ATP-binding protein [Rubrivivax sp.]|nr:phosphonate ABC transporter ATP-binding protein [Rubrivivax sp.]